MIEILKNIEVHHVALVLGVLLFALLVIFRNSLSHLLSRITTINKSGITALPVPDEVRAPQKERVDKLLDIGKSKLLTETESNIFKELQDENLEVEGDTIQILVRHLAIAQIEAAFENTYCDIFGSQINLLKMINKRRSGMLENDIQDYFLHIKDTHNEFKNWEIDNYLNFLYSKLLIAYEDQKYHITVRGIEFLEWIYRNGKSDRPL